MTSILPVCELRLSVSIQYTNMCARCPNRVGSEKNLYDFFLQKFLEIFVTPPTRPPGPPAQGGAPPAPAAARRRGDPQKRGRPSRAEFRAKKCKKGAKIGGKWGFWGQKCAKMCTFCTFLTKSQKRAGSYAGEKTLHSHPCPLCKNPPIYTVLNAAFSAPHPPLGGTSGRESTPEGFSGTPPKSPAQTAPPRTLPERLLHVALADGVL